MELGTRLELNSLLTDNAQTYLCDYLVLFSSNGWYGVYNKSKVYFEYTKGNTQIVLDFRGKFITMHQQIYKYLLPPSSNIQSIHILPAKVDVRGREGHSLSKLYK
jgi:hypothetical protein